MANALVNHPYFGSVWLSNARVQGDLVIGEVVEDRMLGHDILGTMNFPVTCIRKWEGTGLAPQESDPQPSASVQSDDSPTVGPDSGG